MYVQSCQLLTLSSGILTLNSGSKVYADRAISGGSAFRDGYRQLLADLETGTFKGIVCEALDRLGRKLSDVARAITGTRWSAPRFFGLQA